MLFECILSAGAILFALASPFINAIDLVGSLFAKSTEMLMPKRSDEKLGYGCP